METTFAKMRDSSVREILVYCLDYRCSNSMVLMADHRPGDVRLSNIEMRFVCPVCGKRGADIRPNFNWHEISLTLGTRPLELSIRDEIASRLIHALQYHGRHERPIKLHQMKQMLRRIRRDQRSKRGQPV